MDRFNNLDLPSLEALDQDFLALLEEVSPALCQRLKTARINFRDISSADYSKLIVDLAAYLDDFIERHFDITKENSKLRALCEDYNVLFDTRRNFVQRYALQKYPLSRYDGWTKEAIGTELAEISALLLNQLGKLDQFKLAMSVMMWRFDEDKFSTQLDIAAKYCSLMVYLGSNLAIFDVPQKYVTGSKIRPHRLKKLNKQLQEVDVLGFDHRDQENMIDNAQLQAGYCIFCHNQQKDTCRTGLDKTNKGCPLDQKISEMNLVRQRGYNIGALGIITIDNPLAAITGHRICSDCAEGCIFQKQDPVNVPLVETNILNSVLKLPYGVEIYYLLTQWNPLKLVDYLPAKPSGRKILVTGMGPAGAALAYYMLREGHSVTAIDGLKITPLPFDPSENIVSWSEIQEQMSERLPRGFGGVTEYGITARWNKNFLTLVRIILERQEGFRLHGSCRLGSNITIKQAVSEYGFDHIALCLGAGKPRYLPHNEYFLKGIKSAADFLMQLHQGAPYLKGSNSTLQIRLPAIVVGCGLTAIDSAIELLNYYQIQIKKFAAHNNREILHILPPGEAKIASEYLEHARLLETCSSDAERLEMLHKLGGVRIIYRRELSDSPAYRQNSEEVEQLLSYEIPVDENVEIMNITSDEYGAISGIELSDGRMMGAKTLLVSVGTEATNFVDQSAYFNDESSFFKRSDKRISYFGDCNPEYHGSVVKALASVKDGFKEISEAVNLSALQSQASRDIAHDLESVIVSNIEITDSHVHEIIVKAPLAARNCKPGQFFRLQNYAENIAKIMEPLALTAADIDQKHGLLTFLVSPRGKTSQLFCKLPVGEKIAIMGPAGEASNIPAGENIAIVTHGFGAAMMLAYYKALKDSRCRITLISTHAKAYKEQIESLVDEVYWCNNDAEIKTKTQNTLTKNKNIYCMGNAYMMQHISEMVDPEKNHLICSLNLPMQCMMKGICGQCVQKVDDERGYIFSCSVQDQPGNSINFDCLKQRHSMNSLLEMA